MRLRSAVLLLAAFVPIAARAQTATFDLTVDNKVSGRDTYMLAKDKHGYKLLSKYHYNVHAVDGDFLNQSKFSDSYSFGEASLSDNGPTPITISYTLNKARVEATQSRFQAGSQNSSFFAIKKDFYLLPPFDAGAIQVLVLAETQPTAPSTLSIYGPDAESRRDPVASDARWTKGPVVSGTLDGAHIAVQSYLLSTQGFQWIVYAGEANMLLECDLPTVKTSYVREHFKLDGSPLKTADFNHKTAS